MLLVNRWLCWVAAYILVALSLTSFSVHADDNQINKLVAEAEQYRRLGFVFQAEAKLNRALALTEPKSKAHTLVAGLQGNLLIQRRQYDQAYLLLTKTLQIASNNKWYLLAGDHAYYLGNLSVSRANETAAIGFYEQALDFATLSNDTAMTFSASLNLARLSLPKMNFKQAFGSLESLASILGQRYDTTMAIALAELVVGQLQYTTSEEQANKLVEFGYVILARLQASFSSNSPRQNAEIQGQLGKLYGFKKRYADATQHLQAAIHFAQQKGDKDLLYRFEWELANLMLAQNNSDYAIASLRRAVKHLEAIRQDIPVQYSQGKSSFRETLEPLYTQLADLLLQQAKSASEAQQQAFLQEARETIELVKRSELEDYFANRCTFESAKEQLLEDLATDVAAVYPIMLDDRLEILVSVGARIHQHIVPVSKQQLSDYAHRTAASLRSFDPNYDKLAEQFYQWLIAPIENTLTEYQINTLIYLPDGALRLVPLSSLSSGGRPLIFDYAVVTSPGLSLFDISEKPKQDMNVLLAGLSEPGPVVSHVGKRIYSALDAATDKQLQNRIEYAQQASYLTPSSKASEIINNNRRKLRIVSKTPVEYARSKTASSDSALNIVNKIPVEAGLRRMSMQRHQKRFQHQLVAVNTDKSTNGSLKIVAKYTPNSSVTDITMRRLSMSRQNKRQQRGKSGNETTAHKQLKIVNKRPVLLASSDNLRARFRSVENVSEPRSFSEKGSLRIKSKRPVMVAAVQSKHSNIASTATREMGSTKLRIINKQSSIWGQDELTTRQLDKLKQRLRLPGVTEEINHIASLYQHTALTDANFQKAEFESEILNARYDIVHIASHGVFGDSAQNSFIMTFDELLTMEQLETLLVNEKFQKAPIELLTLSACQTAEGDDRAPLGISGIALRAKVRSALGALWAVSDEATVELMNRFYANLRTPGISKAEALRQAQASMLQEPKYQHPFFWSAFVLIGNWL
ncbi:MAG: CHAT domain-containing protein [Alteromonadaceae bacterium]|nr:CHAT domain-containing protein [Alteromonadaceae bacterium]